MSWVGLGIGTEQCYVHGFPCKCLGSVTVVDVGGGIGKSHIEFPYMRTLCINDTLAGSFCMQLHRIYPELSLVIQDRRFVIRQLLWSGGRNTPLLSWRARSTKLPMTSRRTPSLALKCTGCGTSCMKSRARIRKFKPSNGP